MGKIGYILLAIVAGCWLIAMIAGIIATFPVGMIGLLAIAGIGSVTCEGDSGAPIQQRGRTCPQPSQCVKHTEYRSVH